jgi:hypothetical protein
MTPRILSIDDSKVMRSLLARRVREGQLDAESQGRIVSTFEADIALGHLVLLPHTVESFLVAESLLGTRPGSHLRTLDALHLGTVLSAGVTTLATADRVMAEAATALGLQCETFF